MSVFIYLARLQEVWDHGCWYVEEQCREAHSGHHAFRGEEGSCQRPSLEVPALC